MPRKHWSELHNRIMNNADRLARVERMTRESADAIEFAYTDVDRGEAVLRLAVNNFVHGVRTYPLEPAEVDHLRRYIDGLKARIAELEARR